MNIFDYAQQIKDAVGASIGVHAASNVMYQLADFVLQHRWNRKDFPPNEQEVLILIEHRYPGAKPNRSVARAFYEDGTMKELDSYYCWDLTGVENLDEDGDRRVPRGWYELTNYGEGCNTVTDGVIGWQQVPDPWEGEKKEDDNK